MVIIDQSSDNLTEKLVQTIDQAHIKYYRLQSKGLSKARNAGIGYARGRIIAFTDDDCIVNPDWLLTIETSFKTKKQVMAVMGQVLPYQPKLHPQQLCHGVIRFDDKEVINRPKPMGRIVFSGNNLSVRRKVFKTVGGFYEWLGVGSRGAAAEDEEFLYRMLNNHMPVMLNPQMVVYHDRWMTQRAQWDLWLKYSRGFFVAFGFYGLNGDWIAARYLRSFMAMKWRSWLEIIRTSVKKRHFRYVSGFMLTSIPYELTFFISGLVIAGYQLLKYKLLETL